jgi:DNA-binding XRE family transcriptional regulator
MLVDNDEADARLSSPLNLANRFSIRHELLKGKGRPDKKENLTQDERDEIAVRARAGENQTKLAKEFGISQPSISHIERGKSKTDEVKVEKALNHVRDRALSRLMSSLGLLTDDKLSGCSARDLSLVAANMSRVVEKTIPKENTQSGINLIIYSPELKRESGFKVVEI